MPRPNRYGALAQRHMREYLPKRYAQISDPDNYFSDLGEAILDQVLEAEVPLQGEAPAGEEWLASVGRRNMARLMAEELVFAEMVFLPPEMDLQEPDAQPADWVATFPLLTLRETEVQPG